MQLATRLHLKSDFVNMITDSEPRDGISSSNKVVSLVRDEDIQSSR